MLRTPPSADLSLPRSFLPSFLPFFLYSLRPLSRDASLPPSINVLPYYLPSPPTPFHFSIYQRFTDLRYPNVNPSASRRAFIP